MNVQQLLTALADITARPDKAALMLNAINKTCHRISIMHCFKQDLDEVSYVIDPVGATSFSIPSSVYGQALRKIDYLQVVGTSKFLRQIDPKEVFCKERVQIDVFYRTGSAIYVNLAEAANSLLLGFYKYPDLLMQNTDTNWITEMYPFVVLDGAAAMVFKSIGDDTSQARHEEEFRVACAQLTNDLKFGEA